MSLEKERVEALQRVIDELRDEPGALMPIMQRAQDIFGYLPEDVQKYIAKEMDIPVSDVYGVATFYAQFNLEPKGQYTISVCMGTACYVKCWISWRRCWAYRPGTPRRTDCLP